ncbi:MAG: hydrogenase maturation nickel metallochaperone HypA/HybF [Planctomycetota bacterium]|jgi:hydrogenase nickel incorporation protein HypA/HybF
MHEAMVAQSLITAISAEAAKLDAKPVAARVSCGQLNAVNDEALCFAFEAIAKDTVCEATKLEIEHKPLQATCRKCDEVFEFEGRLPSCPKCAGQYLDLLDDAPLLLEEIEFELEQDNES